MVKLLMSWDIQKGKEQEYLEFVRDFSSVLMRMGLVISDAWLSQAGSGPQVVVGVIAEDEVELRTLLQGGEWHELRGKLFEYVTNFRARITTPHPGGFQL